MRWRSPLRESAARCLRWSGHSASGCLTRAESVWASTTASSRTRRPRSGRTWTRSRRDCWSRGSTGPSGTARTSGRRGTARKSSREHRVASNGRDPCATVAGRQRASARAPFGTDGLRVGRSRRLENVGYAAPGVCRRVGAPSLGGRQFSRRVYRHGYFSRLSLTPQQRRSHPRKR